MAFEAFGRKLTRFAVLSGAVACVSLGVAAAPYAAGQAGHAKVPACAKGQHSTAKKPCKAAKTSTSTAKFVAIPVCNAGQKSTTAKPCITLANNGTTPTGTSSSSGGSSSSGSSGSSSSSTSTSTSTTTTTATATQTQPLVGPHINSHLCQTAQGIVFECTPIPDYDPGAPRSN